MLPTTDDIAKFISVAPDASEGKALIFLQAGDAALIRISTDCLFYEDPDRYSHPPANKSNQEPNATDTQALPPSYESHANPVNRLQRGPHTNAVIQAAQVRARDEQEMQNLLQNIQRVYQIFNSDIEPEHENGDYVTCNCEAHQYRRRKARRIGVQDMWSKAVMYPGEKAYHDSYQATMFSNNPYRWISSPYGLATYVMRKPDPARYTESVRQTISLNATLNMKAQTAVNAMEPRCNIWELDDSGVAGEAVTSSASRVDEKTPGSPEAPKRSKFSTFKKALSMGSSDRSASKANQMVSRARELRNAILEEESGRWPDPESRQIVAVYQEKVGMTQKIAELRAEYPLEYLHLLRAGYFESIPVDWATHISNPLKFRIDAPCGWRGITPTWRGYENTAEERLYWVLNHRTGSRGAWMKPDFISAMDMARERMATAVEPPPAYYSPDDTFRLQELSDGYSRQVMPAPFRPFDLPESATDNTMILLDVSGSMDFDPMRPVYKQYLVTGFTGSTQPKNKDVAKAIIRRFTDAMSNHDHNAYGYQLVTFANKASNIGLINHANLDDMWNNVKFGGGTRVMTGWQKIKDLHFQRYSESATYHPVYGWQAGPRTPMLRLLLLLDGEATDMDEFELDLLGLSWVHVTIFLIGVDGCPHHHRHANELQRISQANPHVSFVEAQGNAPERYVTHELLKRHLGYDVSISEFERLEQFPESAEPPVYTE
ncbi:hypothetical protein BO94DRAFT_546230 [Aspergillus sclerotioniger CBS 115572]|uniref:VWFA domain-containing protein n=1 Tax=Aspergillus sclerotioniger CBS 115572 TaxID=1450535 RepID=A0A317WNX6_9EURO|nr:hypothetical protein BO94DRAFT_546230 [Aspergillus sclerotioniger CBS 115572]PWY88093.1 hypothetical protein BO94DRAFT_546230 [Aspergillus sclerotioniger CBS 115572]